MKKLMPIIQYTIAVKTVSEMNKREHWASRYRRSKKQRGLAKLATLVALNRRSLTTCSVTIVRIGPKRLDSDNLASSLKGVRDGIADALNIEGHDNDMNINWTYTQSPIGKRQYGVHVVISW